MFCYILFYFGGVDFDQLPHVYAFEYDVPFNVCWFCHLMEFGAKAVVGDCS